MSLYPGVVAAPLILGTLAGSGGKMITDGIRGGWGALPGTAEVSVPGFVWRSAALAAAGYWGASKATGLLTSQEAAALVITVLVGGLGRDRRGAKRAGGLRGRKEGAGRFIKWSSGHRLGGQWAVGKMARWLPARQGGRGFALRIRGEGWKRWGVFIPRWERHGSA